MLSYYQILQVEETATDAEIKQAYRSLVKILHPDLNNNSSEANTIFRLLQQAYDTLSDPLKRKAYDIDPSSIDDDDDDDVDPRIESYREQNKKQGRKLKEYEEMLKDYKQSVYVKNERERELTKEVSDLKERILKSEKETYEKLKVQVEEEKRQEEEMPNQKTGFSWSSIILLIIGANIGLFLFYLAISSAYRFFFQAL